MCYFKLALSAVTRKLADLRDKIIAKINKKFREFKSDFTTEINGQITNEVNEAIGARTTGIDCCSIATACQKFSKADDGAS